MWILSLEGPPSEAGRDISLPATSARKFTIGRKSSDITFPSDLKVSSEHCRIETQAAGSAALAVPAAPAVTFTDCSRYGSSVNGRKVHNSTESVFSGDLLQIGDRLARLVWRPVCLCRSRIDADGRAFIEGMADKLGVHVTDEWSSQVTHLAMSKVSFTPKLLLALAHRVPVVVPHWLTALDDALRRLGPRPDVSGTLFVPLSADTWRNVEPQAIERRDERKSLFAQRHFVFYAPAGQPLGAQVAISAEIVRTCGGAAHLVPCAPAGAAPRADGDALEGGEGEEARSDGAAARLHVLPARGLALAPAAAAALETARSEGRVVSEECIRVCLIGASLAPLNAALAAARAAAGGDSQAQVPSPAAGARRLLAPLAAPLACALLAPPPSGAEQPAAEAVRKRPQPDTQQQEAGRPSAKRKRAPPPMAAVHAAGPPAQREERGERMAAEAAGAPPQPAADEDTPEQQPAAGAALPRAQTARQLTAPLAGWRSRRAGCEADNMSLSQPGAHGEEGARVPAGADQEAARIAVMPLVSRAPNAHAPSLPRKRFSKAPIRRVGQAYVALVRDDPTLGEDEEEHRREMAEEQRYAARADRLYAEAKDLPKRAPAKGASRRA